MSGLTSLPLELYDKITTHYAQIEQKTDGEAHPYKLKTLEANPSKPETCKPQIGKLKKLRLVSEPFCQSASRLLFRRFSARLREGEESSTVVASLTALEELCQSDHARFVQKLDVGCHGHNSAVACEEYHSYFQKVFASCLERLTSLQRLIIIHCDTRTALEGARLDVFQLIAPPKLQELHLWKVQGIPSYFSPTHGSVLTSLLQNLTYLDINYHPGNQSPGSQVTLTAFQNCRNLHHINIDFSVEGNDLSGPVSFIHPTAPLRSFSLYESTISSEQLLLLRQFRETLTDVDLKHRALSMLNRYVWCVTAGQLPRQLPTEAGQFVWEGYRNVIVEDQELEGASAARIRQLHHDSRSKQCSVTPGKPASSGFQGVTAIRVGLETKGFPAGYDRLIRLDVDGMFGFASLCDYHCIPKQYWVHSRSDWVFYSKGDEMRAETKDEWINGRLVRHTRSYPWFQMWEYE
ncbi:hypothetical protein BBP40_002706 [Aspergillus hancockii]|nr:hypothetical protein BBP40_002706 [Aspergillus hancockii]